MLRFPRARWFAALLAIVLPSPALFGALYTDDLALVARLEGRIPMPDHGPLGLYTFAKAGEAAAAVGDGPFPWWTLPELRLAFFRPLASALFALGGVPRSVHPKAGSNRSVAGMDCIGESRMIKNRNAPTRADRRAVASLAGHLAEAEGWA